MTGLPALNIVLDLLVMGCLGVAIYYAHRLSQNLETFRRARDEFGAIMKQLSSNIDDAYQAVEGLKRATKDAGANLQKTLNDSRKMANELEMLNKVSEKLGEKLETLAEKNKRIAQGLEDPGEFGEEAEVAVSARESTHERGPSFAIVDKDFEEEDEFLAEPSAPSPSPQSFRSQAERDLFDALQKRRAPGRGGA